MQMFSDRQLTMDPFEACPNPKCTNGIPISDNRTIQYFNKRDIICSECGEKLDWWNFNLNMIKQNFLFSQTFYAIGAKTTYFEITMNPDEIAKIKFEEHGLPKSARLLSIGYTIKGSLWPLEIHGNCPQRHFVPREVHLYPRPLPNQEIRPSKVSISFVWIPDAEEDESWQNLCDAFEAYGNKKFKSSIVPANVAVEAQLIKVLQTALQESCPRKKIRSFLKSSSYYNQLNVVLPSLLIPKKFPLIPDHILEFLNKLRTTRNDIAHEGYLDHPLTVDDTASMLCAALFGFRYMQYIEAQFSALLDLTPVNKT